MFISEESYPFYNLNEKDIDKLSEKISDNYNSLNINSQYFQHYVVKNDIEHFNEFNLKKAELYFDSYLKENDWKVSYNSFNKNNNYLKKTL